MAAITSTRNPIIQAAKALQTKAGREQSGLFLCEGEHMVAEALQAAPQDVVTLFVADTKAAAFAGLLSMARSAQVYTVPEHVLAALSQVKTPQGIVATVRKPRFAELSPHAPGAPLSGR